MVLQFLQTYFFQLNIQIFSSTKKPKLVVTFSQFRGTNCFVCLVQWLWERIVVLFDRHALLIDTILIASYTFVTHLLHGDFYTLETVFSTRFSWHVRVPFHSFLSLLHPPQNYRFFDINIHFSSVSLTKFRKDLLSASSHCHFLPKIWRISPNLCFITSK